MTITADEALWPECIAAFDCPIPPIFPSMQYDWIPGSNMDITYELKKLLYKVRHGFRLMKQDDYF